MIVSRLPNRYTGECSGHFRHLYVMYWSVNASVCQSVKDFIHEYRINWKLKLSASANNVARAAMSFCKMT